MAAPSSNKCALIALLVAFAVAGLQPSAASSRVEEALASFAAAANRGQEAAVPVPPPANGGGTPPLPPQPAECRPWLMRMMPCAGFLTNPRVYAPEATCCAGFNSMFTYETVTCLCHVVNGDIDRLLPAPMMHMRMLELFTVCGHDVRVEILNWACSQLADDVPPIDLPSPPPSSSLPSPAPAPSVTSLYLLTNCRMAVIN
ncbi:hypothetical protein BS78_02G128100 [Paspalum vaginatum]|nr:hypothetical protein BS78_02G128100 [Paspalum vaginatum]